MPRCFRRVRIGHYVIAFEDLADGGDQDFEDVIIDLTFYRSGCVVAFVCWPDKLPVLH